MVINVLTIRKRRRNPYSAKTRDNLFVILPCNSLRILRYADLYAPLIGNEFQLNILSVLALINIFDDAVQICCVHPWPFKVETE